MADAGHPGLWGCWFEATGPYEAFRQPADHPATREIGVRRAVGARQSDIVRQFVIEATMISFVGGTLGIGFGFFMSRLIAWLAGWSTIVTVSSIVLAFAVSITVGLVFGIYPAVKAARLDPVEAIHYE